MSTAERTGIGKFERCRSGGIRNGSVAEVARADHLDLAWRYARDHADALEAFARDKLPEGALVEVRRGADEIRTRAALQARLAPQLAAALAAR